MSGKNHHRWKGGRMNRKGRIYVLAKNHPHANRDGYVPESRRIVERALGRYLKPSEVVHHINQDKRDNRNTNLLVCSNQYHSWLHGKGMSEQTRMKLSEISKALWRNSEYRKKHKRLHREP